MSLILSRLEAARRFVRAIAAAQVVFERLTEGNHQPADPLSLGIVDCRQKPDLQAEISIFVDELAPELAGFPPTIVSVAVAKRRSRSPGPGRSRRSTRLPIRCAAGARDPRRRTRGSHRLPAGHADPELRPTLNGGNKRRIAASRAAMIGFTSRSLDRYPSPSRGYDATLKRGEMEHEKREPAGPSHRDQSRR